MLLWRLFVNQIPRVTFIALLRNTGGDPAQPLGKPELRSVEYTVRHLLISRRNTATLCVQACFA